jgi:hypothetical protein
VQGIDRPFFPGIVTGITVEVMNERNRTRRSSFH